MTSLPFSACLLSGVLALACSASPRASARDAADARDMGRIVPPRTASERQLLAVVGRLPTGTPHTLGHETVIADAAYDSAANGRTCRTLRFSGGSASARQRVACTEGHGWFFVPDVLGVNLTPGE